MTRIAVPPGYVLVRLDDLADLLGSRPQPGPPPAKPHPATEPGATWEGLAGAVGLLTARLASPPAAHPGLPDDTSSEAVLAALLTVTAATLRHLLGDQGEALLRDLGLLAAREGTQ